MAAATHPVVIGNVHADAGGLPRTGGGSFRLEAGVPSLDIPTTTCLWLPAFYETRPRLGCERHGKEGAVYSPVPATARVRGVAVEDVGRGGGSGDRRA